MGRAAALRLVRTWPGRIAAAFLVLALCAGIVVTLNATTSASTAVSRGTLHIDFGTRTTAAPRGYLLDYGLPYSATRGFGWEKASNGKALSVVRNGVRRTTGHPPDRRYATLVQMQAAHGVTTPVRWQAALVNGLYEVTVAVGDAAATDSVDRLTAQPGTAQQVVLVGGFIPTAAHHFFTVSKRVRVSNGRLTLTPSGGHNTKIDFVVATPVSLACHGRLTLTAGGTVSPTCQVSGFDRVLPNTAGTQCDVSKIAFGTSGLTLTSTSGSSPTTTSRTRCTKTSTPPTTSPSRAGGRTGQPAHRQLPAGRAFFGPDQNNFVKVEAEHNGPGAPHLTMFYRENKVAGVVDTIAVPALTTATTLDLTIRARSHQLTVLYSLNGAPKTQVGTTKTPADVASWFAPPARPASSMSNSGSPTSITATFNRLAITWP